MQMLCVHIHTPKATEKNSHFHSREQQKSSAVWEWKKGGGGKRFCRPLLRIKSVGGSGENVAGSFSGFIFLTFSDTRYYGEASWLIRRNNFESQMWMGRKVS